MSPPFEVTPLPPTTTLPAWSVTFPLPLALIRASVLMSTPVTPCWLVTVTLPSLELMVAFTPLARLARARGAIGKVCERPV